MKLIKKMLSVLFFATIYIGFFWLLPILGYNPSCLAPHRVVLFHVIAGSVIIMALLARLALLELMDGK